MEHAAQQSLAQAWKKLQPGGEAWAGCRVLTPRYWTNVSSFSFNFTSFADSGTGIRGYEWGLDSDVNGTNVVDFRPFDGTIMVSVLHPRHHI